MSSRKTTAALFLLICLLVKAQQCFGFLLQQQDFPDLLQQLAALSPDPCITEDGKIEPATTADTLSLLFDRAADTVIEQLNTTDAAQPEDRAAAALTRLEQLSTEANTVWPEESRFHFQILHLSSSAFAAKITFRTDARFYIFGIAEQDDFRKPNRLWLKVDEGPRTSSFRGHSITLYPLQSGPSMNVRFLTSIQSIGCAGNTVEISYDAREWSPAGSGRLEQIIKQDAVLNLNDKVAGFPQIGKLKTQGALITLPYCWFSSLDTWDNPSLCAVDTYDLSGDQVKFHDRRYNRPDLLPIAKAIEYAQQHDYRAVLSYCASGPVARRLVRNVPPFAGAEDLQVTSTGDGRERVKFGYDGYRFDVEKRAAGWMIVDFKDR